MIYSERTEAEIVQLTQKCFAERREWINTEHPTAADILKQFPRLADTPTLVSISYVFLHYTALKTFLLNFTILPRVKPL